MWPAFFRGAGLTMRVIIHLYSNPVGRRWRGWAIIEEIMLYVCWFLFLWFAIHYGWRK